MDGRTDGWRDVAILSWDVAILNASFLRRFYRRPNKLEVYKYI